MSVYAQEPLNGKAASLAANEKAVTPKATKAAPVAKPPLSTKPAPLNTKPAPINKNPAPVPVPKYKGKSGNFGGVVKAVEKAGSNIVHSVDKPAKSYSFNAQGKVVSKSAPGIGKQAAAVTGLPSEVFTHPVRWVQQQQHLSPQQKAESAMGLHVLGALYSSPAASRIEGSAARRGLDVAFSGGGEKKAEESAIPSVAKDVQERLAGARSVRGQQEVGYNAERGKRFAAAEAHLQNTDLHPSERLALARGELKGELPKIEYKGFKELDPEALRQMQEDILSHPHLMTGQKIRAAKALESAVEGKVPTKGEITLLEHVFGKKTAAGIGKVAESPSLLQNLLRVANIPRSLMASFDVSAPARQGLVAMTRHPVISAKNFPPMLKSLVSENYYQSRLGDIESRSTYPLMMEAKLAITKLGDSVGAREEQFPTDLAEKIPVIGRGVRGSGRAYTEYLDKTRADIFDHMIERAKAQGVDIHNEKFLKGLGSLINNSTGRGDLSKFEEAANVLNTFFFSPRLLASRINIIAAPLKYARADPFVRREALRTWIHLAGTLTAILALASRIPGVKVVMDPRNPDWGKIKHGNTRIDIAGGFQQPLRLAAQLATGEAISSTTGKKLNLTANGFGQPTRLDIFLRFFEGKESPIASLGTDWLRNSNQVGQKFSWKSEVGQRVIPLLAQDAYDLYKSRHGGVDGITAAFLGYGVGSVGFGLQTYGPKPPKGRSPSSSYDPIIASSPSGGSDYAQSGASAGSSYAQSP